MNPTLRTWWSGLTEDEQVAWYKKWQEHGQGKKKTFDNDSYEEFAGYGGYRHVDYIPFIIFRRHGLADQKDEPTILREFEDIVADPNIHCKWDDNKFEWLVPGFQGIKDFGHRGPMLVKVDNEPVTLAFREAFMEKLPQGAAPVETPVRESQSNGGAEENGVKFFKGLLRVHLAA